MKRRSHKPASLRGAWTLPPDDGTRGRWLRFLRRLIAVVVLLALFVLFFYLLIGPFWHPTLYLRFAAVDAYDEAQWAGSDYATEDARKLREHLAPGEHPDSRVHVLRTADDLRELDASLGELPGGMRDVPIIYVAAQGLVMEGRAYLLSQDFDALNPERGRYPLDTLLERIAQSGAGSKILILDAGRVDYDVRLGMVADEFTAKLHAAVRDLGRQDANASTSSPGEARRKRSADPRLWVLASHASLESPLVMHSRRQTAFGFYLAEAFGGRAADANGDRLLDLGELFQFVRRRLDEFSRAATGGRRSQTPLLLRAGADVADIRQAPVLRAVGGFDLSSLVAEEATKKGDAARSAAKKKSKQGAGKGTSAAKKGDQPASGSTPETAGKSESTDAKPADDAAPQDSAEGGAKSGEERAESADEPASETASGADAKPNTGGKPSANSKPGASTQTKPADPTSSTTSGAARASPPPRTALDLDVPGPDADLSDVLAAAHRATSEYERRDPRYEPHPLAVAAPAWRAWRSRLDAYDVIVRTAGPDLDRPALAEAVRRDLLELVGLPPDDPTVAPSPYAAGLAALRSAPELPPGQLPTWAMAERAGRWSDAQPPAAVATLVARLDQVLGAQDEAATRELAKDKWPEEAERFVELRFARRLLRITGLTPDLRRLAWETIRRGEATAADPYATVAWIRPTIELADAHRLAATRGLRDQLGEDWRGSSRARWEAALRRYDDAERMLADVHAARHVHAVLTDRLPRYLRWYQAVQGDESLGPDYQDLVRLLEQLEQLGELLSNLDDADYAKLASVRDLIVLTQSRIERRLQPTELSRWLSAADDGAKPWTAGRFLKSGLVPTEFAARLGAVERADAGVGGGVRGAARTDAPVGATPPILAADEWRPAARQLALERLVARLSVAPRRTTSAGQSAAETEDERDVRALLERLDAVIAAQAPEIVEGAPGPLRGTSDSIWAMFREAGGVLGAVRAGLASRAVSALQRHSDLRNLERRPHGLRQLREADRYVRLIDSRDVPTLESRDIPGRIRRAELYDLLKWQRRRAIATQSDAPADEYDEATTLAAQCRRLASDLPQEPQADEPAPALPVVDGSNEVPLVSRPQKELALRLRPSSGYAGPVWLVLAYDPALLEIESTDVRAYREFEVRAEAAKNPAATDETPDYPLQPAAIGGPASWEIASGAARDVRLVVRRKGAAGRSTRLIVKFVGHDFAVRHELNVLMSALDAITLVPSGFSGSWTRQESLLVLHPLPNQRTDFRFALANQGETEKTVDVEVLAPQRPLVSPGVLSLPESEALDAIGPTESLGRNPRLKLPAGGQLVPFLPVGGDEPAESATSRLLPGGPERGVRLDGQVGGAVNGGPEDAPEPAADATAPGAGRLAALLGRRVNHGLLFVIRDGETKQTLFRRLEVRPLHPRAYLNVSVGYDLAQQRIEISVKPRDRDLIPPNGLKVRCETPEPLPPGSESRLEGTIAAPQFEARLYLRTPADEGRAQSLSIGAGNYPRAFFYRVPCGVASADLPEADDVLAVRVLAPETGKWYKAPVETIPVKVEVDAPRGAFANGRDMVEIGLDVDRDREFRGELSLPFSSDRQSEAATRGFQGAVLPIETRVGDFEFDLPTGGLQNTRANVLGRVRVGNRSAWSAPVEVVLDGAPPVIRRVHLNPKTPPASGGEVEVIVSAVDGQMSGVDRVDVGLDPRLTGEFGADASPVPATPGEPTVWTAKVPLADVEPGQSQILVRAFDRAGNASPVTKLALTVLPKQGDKDAQKAAAVPGRIDGEVKYAERPIPNADVFLEGDVDPKTRKRKTVGATKADAQGKFVFARVPPGTYVVRVRGLANNRMRLGSQEVKVVSPPDQTPALLIKAK